MPKLDLMRPTLDQLLEGIADAPAVPIHDLSLSSRHIRKGSAFFARRGTHCHGLDFAGDAIRAGAAAIVYEPSGEFIVPSATSVPWVAVPGLGMRLGEIAERFFGYPSRQLRAVAVTGTNGKTTVAWLISQALRNLQQACGYIGTLGCGSGAEFVSQTLTTPDVFGLNRCLRRFVDQGADFAALEASSHALHQDRLQGLAIECAVFTNLSRDHLDYHGSMQHYAAAKALLFSREGLANRVICTESDFGRELAGRYRDAIVVSRGVPLEGCAYYAASCREEFDADGLGFVVVSHAGEVEIRSKLVGSFNVSNLLSALGALLALGFGLDVAADALVEVGPPPGRMQRVGGPAGPLTVVDFAHTPAALGAALEALAQHTPGKLWCVFGCGGDRDRGKRPEMARRACRLADRIVITSDNPRSEPSEAILDDIAAGLESGAAAEIIADREAAIRFALERAGDADTVLVAGKGHEAFQEIRGQRFQFSDAGVLIRLRAELGR